MRNYFEVGHEIRQPEANRAHDASAAGNGEGLQLTKAGAGLSSHGRLGTLRDMSMTGVVPDCGSGRDASRQAGSDVRRLIGKREGAKGALWRLDEQGSYRLSETADGAECAK